MRLNIPPSDTYSVADIVKNSTRLRICVMESFDALQFIEGVTEQYLTEHPRIDDRWLPIWHTAKGTLQGLRDLKEQLWELNEEDDR